MSFRRVLLAGICLAWLMSSAVAAETVFGPARYTRMAGPPQTFTETFDHCGTATCEIVVTNGNADGTNRISSASVLLNGDEIVRPRHLNQNASEIVRPVGLSDLNRLTVTLYSKPGGFLVVEVRCAPSGADLVERGAGVSLLDPVTLLSALRIGNAGTAEADSVELTSISLSGGTLTSPASLPLNLGAIPVGDLAVLDADFSGTFVPGGSHTLAVEGTYVAGGSTHCFALDTELVIPPAAPGSAPLATATVPSLTVTGAPFPPRPPAFTEAVNPPMWAVPVAPLVLGTPTPGATGIATAPLSGALPLDPARVAQSQSAPGQQSPGAASSRPPRSRGRVAAQRSPGFASSPGSGIWTRGSASRRRTTSDAALSGTVVFDLNTGGINGSPAASTSTTAEPSGASNGNGVVFVTGNWFAAWSNDGGATFNPINPTTIFPGDAVGFCCDQVVQYVPSIDRFIWLLQGTGYRLASASPAALVSSGGTAWTYWNLHPSVFGQPAGTGFDYPDMSVGNNYLYLGWDAGFGCPTGCTWGFQVARIQLSQIQAGGTIGIGFTNPAHGRMAWGAHISHNTENEVFWAGHNNNSNMRIFTLAEGSNSYFWRDKGISSWSTSGMSSTTPDGKDWLTKLRNFPSNSVHGLTRNGSALWLAWSAGTDGNFTRPHVEMVTLDRNNNFNVIQQVQIWNNDYSFTYPALATNLCTREIGLSLEWGGNGNYENHVVGFWGDFIVYVTTASNVGTTRYGDYVTIRREPPNAANPGNLFGAFGYGLNTVSGPGSGTRVDVHYVRFGRDSSACDIIK